MTFLTSQYCELFKLLLISCYIFRLSFSSPLYTTLFDQPKHVREILMVCRFFFSLLAHLERREREKSFL
jgi:hypothetical protein